MVIFVCPIALSPWSSDACPVSVCKMITPRSNAFLLASMKSAAGLWNQVALIQPFVGCHTAANRSQSPASRQTAQRSTSSRI